MTVSESLEGLNCRFGTADGPCMNFWKLWLPAPESRKNGSDRRSYRNSPHDWAFRSKPEAVCALVHKVQGGEVTTLPATQPTTGGAVTVKRSAA